MKMRTLIFIQIDRPNRHLANPCVVLRAFQQNIDLILVPLAFDLPPL